MPIRKHIEAITKNLVNNPHFIYGNTNEINTLADNQCFPCVFLYPLPAVELTPSVNGSVTNTFTLYLEFLFQTDFDQYTSDNEEYVSHALYMANQFVVKVGNYRCAEGRLFKIKPNTKAKCQPVYNKYDVNTTGVSLTIVLESLHFDTYTL